VSVAEGLSVCEERISDDRPLLALLPALPDDQRFAFVQHDEGVVGWGVAARIPVGAGPARFTRAREALAAFSTDAQPVAFASFTFDADEDTSVVVVPEVAVVRRDGITRRIVVGRRAQERAEEDAGPDRDRDVARTAPVAGDRPRYAGSTVRDDRWLEAVSVALTRIREGTLEKVVLARDVRLWSRQPFDTDLLLSELSQRFPSCMTFLVDHLVGASPELLLRRDDKTLHSRVLAGTTVRGADADADGAAGARLLASAKDRHEHDLALSSAVEALAPVCTDLRYPDAPSLVRLDNVQHLGSDLTGTLDAAQDTHILALLARLHPTAAVGGVPRDRAIATIRELEGMSRGRYAGPVGWCTPDGDGEFAVALRCGEIHGDRARLFAGAGIVAGSLPEDELTETWLKLRAMTGVLGA
jgi:menaquinone-specific isochorismate synthase